MVWQEHLAEHPDGYGYNQYCYHFQQYIKNKDLSMNLKYKAGDIVMIDLADKHLRYIDNTTSECIACEVFVPVLSFSG
jgi:hypothetical protein